MVTILCGASIIAFAKNYEQTYELLQKEKQKSDIQTRELESVNQKLVELDTAKTNFFSNISHEFRTPLTLMLTPLESVISGTNGDSITLNRETAESIRHNCLRLLRLINDLLDFTKIEAGKMSISRQPTDIDAFLRQFVAVVNSSAELMGINLEYIPPEGKIIGAIDRKLMENALYNLISNALKFTPQGGRVLVKLEAFHCARENTDGASPVQNYFSITVSDTGIGISARDREMIFERFTQVDASSSRKYEGSGIGLSITKELVEMHGGVISVESEPEQGSSFKITIPCNFNDNEISDETGNGDGINQRLWGGIIPYDTAKQPVVKEEDELETILVVEDNPEMIKLLNMILESKYNLINAVNGKDALEKMDSDEALPDLVLADVMMPEMNGYEFTRLIRADGRFEGMPVILLTAKADDSMKMEGFESGATDYITKPFNARELTARINAQLEMKKLRDRLSRANQQLYARLKAASAPVQPSLSDSTEEKINLVLNFIHENYSASLSREGLALAVDLSADHLSRAFNRVTGKRIDEYINDLRIEEAKRRLRETADTVISIAFAVGFENVRTFNKVFAKNVGITPSQWRQPEK
jgi:signal transduction histidine kinase/DNA-binding response OmpR family regulator